MPSVDQRTLLILFLPQEWGIYHRRPYWEALARHTPVLLIEPPAGILSFWLHPRRIVNYFRGFGKLRRNQRDFFFLRPLQIVSTGINFRLPIFAANDRMLMQRQIQKAIKQIESSFNEIVIFLVHAQQHHFSGIIPKARQCYEITDLYALPRGEHRLDEHHPHTKRVRRAEKRIISDSDLIITSSRVIFEELKSAPASVHYVNNAADYEHFAKSAYSNLEIPDDMQELPRPRLGFFGNINHLIDYELLAKLAGEFPGGAVVMIGGEHKNTGITSDEWYQRTKLIKNIYYLGFREYDKLPSYLKVFDVCLLPYRLNDWMRYSAPNKTYQYLASGKPVVSIDFPEAHVAEKVMLIAKSHQEFIEMVKNASNDKDESKRVGRQRFAFENSTEKWAEKVMEIIGKSSV